MTQFVGTDKETGERIYSKQQPGFTSFSGPRIQNLLLRFVKDCAEKEGFSLDATYNDELTNLEVLSCLILMTWLMLASSANMMKKKELCHTDIFAVHTAQKNYFLNQKKLLKIVLFKKTQKIKNITKNTLQICKVFIFLKILMFQTKFLGVFHQLFLNCYFHLCNE